MAEIKMHPSWKARLGEEFEKPYMQKLRTFLLSEQKHGKNIYPSAELYFNAFNTTPFSEVKVVILGQDPYHGKGQAHGLCFSVQEGVVPPPSLKNIFKELNTDIGIIQPAHGCLTSWARQGVLLLNSVLTVEDGKPGSHQDQGWEVFTDQVIRTLDREKEDLVFVLWGSYAQKKASFVDAKKHLVLQTPHPSPLSSYRGFFGSRPFSQINKYLLNKNKTPIDWQI